MATKCTRDAVLCFLTERGGRVKHADLIDHFRSFISADSEIKAAVKEAFEDSVAVVKVENGEEYVCLRNRFRGSVKREDGHHDGPDSSSSSSTTTSSSSAAAVLETSRIPVVTRDNRSDDLFLLLLAPVKPGESQSHALNTKDAKQEIPPVPECAGAGTNTPPNISQTGPHRSPASRAFTSSGDKTQMGNQHPRNGGAGNISTSARRSDEALYDARATGKRIPEMSLTQPETDGSRFLRPQGLATHTEAGKSPSDSRSEGEKAPYARDEDEDMKGSGSMQVGTGACEGGAREGRTESASNTPRGSRKSFIEHMMSRSPQLRRSVMHRYSRHAAAAKSDGGESSSVNCAHAEEESAAATLDPLEHEWMMCACDGEWDSLSRLLNRDPSLISKKDFVTGFTCLHWAAKLGKHELLAQVVNFARQRGVALDVNVRSSAGYTPLHLAAVHNHVEVIKLLVGACDADVEARDYSGKKASQYLRSDVARDVLDIAGADAACVPVNEELALGDEASRWKLPRVLQANLRLLNRSASEDDDRDCVAGLASVRPLRRKSSFNKLKPRLSRTRAGIPPIVHSTSHFERLEGATGHTSGPVKNRPKSNLFG